MFEANVVTPTQLAKQFGLSFEELMRVWSEMPMDNAAFAFYQASCQQLKVLGGEVKAKLVPSPDSL